MPIAGRCGGVREAVTIGEEQDGLRLGGETRESTLEVEDAHQARIMGAGAAVGPAVGLVLPDGAVTQGGAVVGPLAKPAHG